MTWQGKRTICQVLRETFDGLNEIGARQMTSENWKDLESVMDLHCKVVEAINMAKRMDAKLREYKADYDKNMWEDREET